MRLPTRIRLSVPEVHYALALATQRDACKQDRDGGTYRHTSGFTVHYAGVVGELCFRRVYGGKIDTTVRPGGDGHTPDILLPDGRRVEVKTSLFSGKGVELKLEPDEVGRFDYCCLVQVSLLDTGLVYPIWSWLEIQPALAWKDYGYGPRRVYRPNYPQEAIRG